MWSAPLLIPGTIEAATSPRVSALSRDKFDCMTNKNARLSKENTKLKQQMALLLQYQQKQPPQQQNAPKMQHPAPTTHSATANDKNILTPEFIH